MSIQPLQCKLCKLILREPEIIVGEPQEMRTGKSIALLLQHFDQAAQHEAQQNGITGRRPHLEAMQQHVLPALISAQSWLKMKFFTLPEYLEESKEHIRRQIAKATRKRSMSDEDLEKLSAILQCPIDGLKNLRDYYEEIGQYAPKQPESAPELVKP
jgi:hypothetical protein